MKLTIALNILVIKVLLKVCEAILWESRKKKAQEPPKRSLGDYSEENLREFLDDKRKHKLYNKRYLPHHKQNGRRDSASFLERGSKGKNDKEMARMRQKLAKNRFKQNLPIYSDRQSDRVHNEFSNNTKDYNIDGKILGRPIHYEKHYDDKKNDYHDDEDIDEEYDEEEEKEDEFNEDFDNYVIEDDEDYQDYDDYDDYEGYEDEIRRRKTRRGRPHTRSYIQLSDRDQSYESIPRPRKSTRGGGLLNTIMSTPVRRHKNPIHQSNVSDDDISHLTEEELTQDDLQKTHPELENPEIYNLFPADDDDEDESIKIPGRDGPGPKAQDFSESVTKKLEDKHKQKQQDHRRRNDDDDEDDYSPVEPQKNNRRHQTDDEDDYSPVEPQKNNRRHQTEDKDDYSTVEPQKNNRRHQTEDKDDYSPVEHHRNSPLHPNHPDHPKNRKANNPNNPNQQKPPLHPNHPDHPNNRKANNPNNPNQQKPPLHPNHPDHHNNHRPNNPNRPGIGNNNGRHDEPDPTAIDQKPLRRKKFKDKWTEDMGSINVNVDTEPLKKMKGLTGDYDDEIPDVEGNLNRNSEHTHEIEGETAKRVTTRIDPRDPQMDWNNSGLAASMRYLGSGYDIIFGNPLGDPVVMMDQGYRNPVIRLNWEDEYLNKDGANLKEPRGSWIRPEYSCRQSETIDHVNTVDDFKKELSVDAQASYGIPYFFSFSASTGYKNFVKSTATNKVRTYITKTYCLRYVGGIVDYHSLDTTDEFKKAVEALPDKFDSHSCTIETFKSNEDDSICAETVLPWMQFIKMFGTHFTTIVHLGGKITHQVQIDKSDVLHMQQNGINVDAAVKASISPVMVDSLQGGFASTSEKASLSQSNNLKYDKQVLVIGGDGLVDSKNANSLNNWAKELYKRPMPIKIKLESIKSLLGKKRELFDEALKFYSETYGVSPDEIYKKFGKEFGIASVIEKGHQIVYSGNKSGSAICPNKTVIIMGFSLSILKKKNIVGKNEFTLHITQCPVGEEKCIVSSDNPMSESRIWAVCGEDTIPLLNQQTSSEIDEPATATCPVGYSIAYGFALSVPKGNVALNTDSYACRSGTQSCTHESTDKTATNSVWIACVENGAPQLSEISNHVVSTSSRHCSKKTKDNAYDDNSCPINSKLIAGWSLDFSEGDENFNKIDKCSKGTFGCKVDQLMKTENKCRSHYSWISCLHEQKTESL